MKDVKIPFPKFRHPLVHDCSCKSVFNIRDGQPLQFSPHTFTYTASKFAHSMWGGPPHTTPAASNLVISARKWMQQKKIGLDLDGWNGCALIVLLGMPIWLLQRTGFMKTHGSLAFGWSCGTCCLEMGNYMVTYLGFQPRAQMSAWKQPDHLPSTECWMDSKMSEHQSKQSRLSLCPTKSQYGGDHKHNTMQAAIKLCKSIEASLPLPPSIMFPLDLLSDIAALDQALRP